MAELFPLTLAPWEEFLVTEDLPGCRKTFVLELDLTGEVDPTSFAHGIDQARQRHPLLDALVERRGWRRPRWVSALRSRPQVDWGTLCQPIEYPDAGRIDLTSEPGARFHVRVGQGRSRISILFHHACCDGYGAIQFLSDLFTAYVHRLTPGNDNLPQFRRIVPERLRRRGALSACVPHDTGLSRFLWKTIALGLRLAFRRTDPLAIPGLTRFGDRHSERLTFPGNLTRTLEQRVYGDLRRLARRKAVTVNDLLICELLIALRDWNRAHAPSTHLKRLGVVVPTNLRNLDHDGMPAANVMGLAFYNRHSHECDDRDALLQSLHAECEFVKNSRLSSAILTSFDFFRRIPGLLKLASTGTFGTVLLSNIGDPWRAVSTDFPVDHEGDPILGNLVLKDVNSVSPMAARTRAAFTVWQACDKLRVGLRCQPWIFSQRDAEDLLDLFVGRIVGLAQALPVTTSIRKAA